ncbi:MAG: hypothetical protein RMK20_07980 [Verrucomicrobiales bacterium]|nr:hypothetical protein [Verrucomicrobiales bacterium]
MLLKMLEAAQAHAEITNRRPAAQPIGLYLMELRARTAQAHRHGPSARIVTEWQTDADTSWPAEIRHSQTPADVLTVVVS